MNRFTGFARTRKQITAKFLQSALVYMCHIQNISHVFAHTDVTRPYTWEHFPFCGNLRHERAQTGGIVVYVLRVVL